MNNKMVGLRRLVWTLVAAALVGSPLFAAPAQGVAGQTAQVVGWGNNSQGQATPPAGLTGVTQVSAGGIGGGFSLALKSDGTVVGWGGNDWGRMQPPDGLNGVAAIAAGGNHSLALKADGTVVGWGDVGLTGATGALVPSGLDQVTAIAARVDYSIALKADGTVVDWGQDQTGPSDEASRQTDLTAISAGGTISGHGITCAYGLGLKSDGTVVGWRPAAPGTFCYTSLDAMMPPQGLSGVVAIAAGGVDSLALKADGTVVGWGPDAAAIPPTSQDHIIAISAGYNYTVSLGSYGSVSTWGSGAPALPHEVNGTVTAISAGFSHGLELSVPHLVGSPQLQPNVDWNPPGTAEAFSYNAHSSGVVGALEVYLDCTSTATTVTVGLYSDVGGRPGKLLTSGRILSPVNGSWNTVTAPGVTVSAGTPYWLALLAPARSGTIRFRDQADGQGNPTQTSQASNLTAATGLPKSWAGGTTYANAPASLYAAMNP